MRPRRRFLRAAPPIAGLAGILAAAHGCIVEFPVREDLAFAADAAGPGPGPLGGPPDAVTGSGPSLRPNENGGPSLADEGRPDARAAVDAERPEPDGTPEAGRPDASGTGAPFVDLRIRGGTAPENCEPLDLTIEYTALNVETCVAVHEPADRDGAVVQLVTGTGTHTWPRVLGVAVVTLTCADAAARRYTDTETRTPMTGLDGIMIIAGRDPVADIQRLCAAPVERLRGGAGDGAVKDTPPSAGRLCACLGYHGATIGESRAPCFSNPMGREIADWKHRERRWDVKLAKAMGTCIEALECSMPAVRCDAWPPL